ncbi:MAG: DNA-3-methyladenine glycosylase I [Granulosicoccus sp.]
MSDSNDTRCPWCLGSKLYQRYHDTEWGIPCRDSARLFEHINLEGAQAGLSWITILNKREAYRKLFHQFDPVKVARMTDARLEKIAINPAIVRHRGKIAAVRGNAQAWLDMQKNGDDFSEFLWSFVDGEVVTNRFSSMQEVPASTPASLAMSKALKKKGFKFVGATICYAFMQASGMVNDHLITCPQHDVVAAL